MDEAGWFGRKTSITFWSLNAPLMPVTDVPPGGPVTVQVRLGR